MSNTGPTSGPQEMLEREIQRLPWVFSVNELLMLLRRLGDTETELASLPPLCAASRFRESVQQMARSGSVTNESLRRAVVRIDELRQTGGSADFAARHVAPYFERAFFIFGLRRGGNHAIAEWLKGHFDDGATLYLNSAEIGFFETDGENLQVDRADYQSIPLAGGQKVLLIGYENLDFLDFPFEHNARIAGRSDLIVVLRDYPNMAASIVKSARERPAFVYTHRLQDFPLNWGAYARHFRDRTGGFVYIRFNDWFASPEYRKGLSDQLGLEFSDRGVNVVSTYGRGSSFDGMRMDGSAQSMKVLSRWKEMMDDDLFCFLLLAGGDNLALNKELFGNFPLDQQEVLAHWSRSQEERGSAE